MLVILLLLLLLSHFSRVQLLATSRTAAYQAPPSTGFSRQEYWSGVPLPSPLVTLTSNTINGSINKITPCYNKFIQINLDAKPTKSHCLYQPLL